MMKNSLSALFVLCAVSLTTLNAQEAQIVSGKIRCSNHSELILPQGVDYSVMDYGTQKTLTPIRPYKADGEEDMVTITVKITSTRKPKNAIIFNKNKMDIIRFIKGKESSIQVPKGTYDLYAEFLGDKHSYVFRENIQATEDQVIEIDQDEANIPIEFHYFDENNQELHLDIYDGKNVATPGTASDIMKLTSFIHKDYGSTILNIDFGYKSVDHPEDFYVNKLSDKYCIGQAATICMGSHYYAIKSLIRDFEQNIHNTDGSSLTRLETGFTLSPGMKDIKEHVNLPGVETTFLLDGNSLGDIRIWGLGDPEENGNFYTYIDCPVESETDDFQMNVAARPIASDGVRMVSMPGYDDEEDFSFIVTPLATGNAKQEVKYHVSCCDLGNFFNVPVGQTSYKCYPGHPDFSFAAPDGKAHFGTSVPLMIYSSVCETYDSEVNIYDSYYYRGVYGELRETDAKLATVNKKSTQGGTLVTVTNNNIEIDGMEGKNVSEVLFDRKKADYTAPTFQMMSFKDKEGTIGNRFQTAQGAKMLVAGGDFSYVENFDYPYIGYFTCAAPASVKAYYSPNGTDTWKELALVEDPAKYYMPAFGHFYETDLSEVTAEDDDMWFDVRLEMTDAAGNYQKQLISPAFFVNNVTSIDNATIAATAFSITGKKVSLTNGVKADITVYSIDGRTLQHVYSNEIDLGTMAPGLYVVTATTADGRVASAKVIM